MSTGGDPRHALRPALVAAGILGISIFFILQNAVGSWVRGSEIEWVRLVWTELYYWVLLALVLPLVPRLAQRLRIRRGQRLRMAAAHSGVAVALGVVHSILYYAPLAVLLGTDEPVADIVLRQLPTATMTVFWKYWVAIGVYYAFDYHRKFLERREHAAALERSLTEARLQALRMQLQPHFLFNTLHTVSMLNLENPDAANRVLARLSEVLRAALDTEAGHEVPLEVELDFIRRYLEIEQARFEDRLEVRITADPELLDACVPHLVLQPLVENAVRHGLAPRRGRGSITVEAHRRDDTLVLRVTDDGPGPGAQDPGPGREGIGLENTRARLSALYGDRGRLRLEPVSGGGASAEVELPLHTEPRGAPP